MKTVVRWTGDRPPPVDGRKALPPTTDFYDSKGSLERMRQGADEIEAQYKKYPRDAQVRVRDWGGASAAITKPQCALTANKLFVCILFRNRQLVTHAPCDRGFDAQVLILFSGVEGDATAFCLKKNRGAQLHVRPGGNYFRYIINGITLSRGINTSITPLVLVWHH